MLIFPLKIKSAFILIWNIDFFMFHIFNLCAVCFVTHISCCKPYTDEGDHDDRQCDRDGPDFLLFLTFLSRGGIVRGPVCFWFCCFGGFAIRGIAAQPVQRYAVDPCQRLACPWSALCLRFPSGRPPAGIHRADWPVPFARVRPCFLIRSVFL